MSCQASIPAVNRSEPAAVKYWSRAGLMVTDGCSAACAACYLRGTPRPGRWMTVETAVGIWSALARVSPHGCRVHVTGGEPFQDWERLREILRAAAQEGLYADSIETNGFWATEDALVHDRLAAMKDLGVRRLAISADPFHQEFIPLKTVRRLAARAEEVFGSDGVRIRWRDWLETGQDVRAMSSPQREALWKEWIASGRDRLNGRAAEILAGLLPRRPAETFSGQNCCEAILRSRHVHVWPDGTMMPGVCAGISLGRAEPPWEESIRGLWEGLRNSYARRTILGRLVAAGPAALLDLARQRGATVRDVAEGFASKCHLCWAVRSTLAATGNFVDEIAPPNCYGGQIG